MGNFGAQELLLLFVSMVFIFAIPVIVIVLLINSRRKSINNELRITELERRLQQLEETK